MFGHLQGSSMMVGPMKNLQSEFDSLHSKLIENEKRLAYLENYVSQMDKNHNQNLVYFCKEMEALKNFLC